MDFTANPYYKEKVESIEAYEKNIQDCQKKRQAVLEALQALAEDTNEMRHVCVEFLEDYTNGFSTWYCGYLNILGSYELAVSDQDSVTKIYGHVVKGNIVFDMEDRNHRRPKVLAGTVVRLEYVSKAEYEKFVRFYEKEDCPYLLAARHVTAEEQTEYCRQKKDELQNKLAKLDNNLVELKNKVEERQAQMPEIEKNMLAAENKLSTDGIAAGEYHKHPVALITKPVQYEIYKGMEALAKKQGGSYFAASKKQRGFVFDSEKDRDVFLDEYQIVASK